MRRLVLSLMLLGLAVPGAAFGQAREVVVSPDGRGVFVLGDENYLATFARDPASGELTQSGCVEGEQTYKACAEARGLFDARGMAVSADGRSLYVANQSAHAVSVFGANVAVASRAAAADRRGRFRLRLACPAARVRDCAGRLRVGTAKAGAYRVRAGASRMVRARLPKRLRRVVRKRGRVRVTVSARDSRRLMAASKRRDVGAPALVRRGAVGAQQLQHLLGVLEAGALAEVDVLLVERHRLVLAAAELA
jgi:hypothetical protein